MGRHPIQKNRKKSEEKRQDWLRKLYPFFRDRGLMGFSMEEVSVYLNVSKATIYNYFSSKDEIIDRFLGQKYKDLQQFEKYAINEDLSLLDRYEKSLFHLLSHIIDFSPQVRKDLELIFPDKWYIFQLNLDQYMERIEALYKEGMNDGVFNNVNSTLLAICDKNMLLYMSDHNQLEKSGLSLKRAFNEFMDMRMNGLRNDPGNNAVS